MKKHFIFVPLVIFAMLVLFVSCAQENNDVVNSINDVIDNSSENLNSENESNILDNNEILTQIGELLITTPKGQEPIQNDDGTITLPSGGSYTNPVTGDKITVPNGTVIKNDGNSSRSFGAYNISQQIKIEQSDGQQLWANYYNWGSLDDDMEEPTDIQAEPIKESPWRSIINLDDNGDIEKIIYRINDKTKIISDNDAIIREKDDGGYFTFDRSTCTIRLTNGVVINAPINTRVEIESGKLTIITIGDSDAIITQSDKTEFTISKGTILDSEGNVIKN